MSLLARPEPQPLDPAWQAWIAEAWPLLSMRGARIPAPPGLPAPGASGFSRPWLSEPAGQVADWTLPLPDGSRIHLHEYAGGGVVAHRDASDPGRGPLRAAAHLVTETTIGRVAALSLVALGINLGLSKLGIGISRIPLAAGILPP